MSCQLVHRQMGCSNELLAQKANPSNVDDGKQFRGIVRVHSALGGVHCSSNAMTMAVSDRQHMIPIAHSMQKWSRLGTSNRVRRAMTASFGNPSVSIPGKYAAIIHLIVSCFCSKLSTSKCLPLPQ